MLHLEYGILYLYLYLLLAGNDSVPISMCQYGVVEVCALLSVLYFSFRLVFFLFSVRCRGYSSCVTFLL